LNIGIVVCSRKESSRIENKPLRKVGFPVKDQTIIGCLLHRLTKTGIPVILAIPENEASDYAFLKDEITDLRYYYGDADSPLERMYNAAKTFNLDAVIRVCHDKIFIDHDLINMAARLFSDLRVDYLFSSHFTDGTGFEIINVDTLGFAFVRFEGQKIEHISYAIKAVTDNVHNWEVPKTHRTDFRLLIDYPVDLNLIDKLFQRFKKRTKDISLLRIFEYLRIYPSIANRNKHPKLTIYTCAYNASEFIEKCMDSVARGIGSLDYGVTCEYILVDDKSTDDTRIKMEDFQREHDFVKVIKNKENIGLASSSNIALESAKGKYIIRLDADDYFVPGGLKGILRYIEKMELEAVYPSNYYGSLEITQKGCESHHVGGAIFNRRSLNDVKFTDHLRGYEGLDLYERAKKLLKIGYYDKEVFFYRQHDSSMSKTNLEEREEIRKGILDGPNTKMA